MYGKDVSFDLVSVGQHKFRVIVHVDGKPFDAEWMELHFVMQEGRATGIEVPNPRGDRIFGRAVRLP